jgi:threonine dehydrogenase-like Zn-dependent dehydrogenase
MYSEAKNQESQFSKQQMIFDWIHRGELKVDPLISHRLKPEQIKEAYEGLLNEPGIYTGVLLDWR